LLAHCGGGQDEPECLGPSAERSGCFISAHALRQTAQTHGLAGFSDWIVGQAESCRV
jgi:hypothetical protein